MIRSVLSVVLSVLLLCAGAELPLPQPEPLPSSNPEVTPEVSVPPETDPAEGEAALPLEGVLVCIDPGHCYAPGFSGYELLSPLSTETKAYGGSGGTTGATLREEQLVLYVGLKLRDKLEALGAQVIMTREVSEIALDGVSRATMGNEAGVDVNIHLHANSYTDPSVRGVMVLVPSGSLLCTPSIVGPSAALGQLMVDSLAEATGFPNLGTVQRDDLVAFNWSETATVLVEMGFMSNPEEDALMSTDEYQERIADGMVAALLAWLGQ